MDLFQDAAAKQLIFQEKLKAVIESGRTLFGSASGLSTDTTKAHERLHGELIRARDDMEEALCKAHAQGLTDAGVAGDHPLWALARKKKG